MEDRRRALRTYTGTSYISLEEAWDLAKQGYDLEMVEVPFLSSEELDSLSSYPVAPGITLQDYMRLRELSREELLLEPDAQGLDILFPGLSQEDILFYLTHGFHPYLGDVQGQLRRYQRYIRLSPLTKELMQIIYPGAEKYAQSRPTILDNILVRYDNYTGDPLGAMVIATDLGMVIPLGVDIDIYLYDTLEKYLILGKERIPLRGYPLFDETVSLSYADFPSWKKKYHLPSGVTYNNRLDYIMTTAYLA